MDLKVEDSRVSPAVELLIDHGFSGLAQAQELLINEAMQIERNRYLQAKPYERSEERQGFRCKDFLEVQNFRAKEFWTSLGRKLIKLVEDT
jgi:Transposase, Mutator family.